MKILKLNAAFFLTFSLFFILSSCANKDKDYDKEKAISAFAAVDSLKIDESLKNKEISIPKAKKNSSFNGSLSFYNQEIENFDKNFSQKNKFFSNSKTIKFEDNNLFYSGFGFFSSADFVFNPIILEDRIFTLNSSANLISFDLETGKKNWKTKIFKKNSLKNYSLPKILYKKIAENEIIFAINGINEIAAVNAKNGEIIWQKKISSIPNSSIIADDENIYFTTNDNKLFAIDIKNGDLKWIFSAILLNTAIFGSADPLIYQDKIIAAFSSGEIYLIDKKTGSQIWSQSLNISKAINSDFYLNDIDATPIIKNDIVFAVGNGGLMMAIDAKNGNYIWRKEISTIADYWAAGEFLFLINNENKLMAIEQKTGKIKWLSQLPKQKKEKKAETKFIYNNVVMIDSKLMISRSDGVLLIASPFDGSIEFEFDIGEKIYHSPIIVGDKIYFHKIEKFSSKLIEIK